MNRETSKLSSAGVKIFDRLKVIRFSAGKEVTEIMDYRCHDPLTENKIKQKVSIKKAK